MVHDTFFGRTSSSVPFTLRTWSEVEIPKAAIEAAYAHGHTAGILCAPGSEPSGSRIDLRLIAEWRRGYLVGRQERLAKIRAERIEQLRRMQR